MSRFVIFEAYVRNRTNLPQFTQRVDDVELFVRQRRLALLQHDLTDEIDQQGETPIATCSRAITRYA